MVKKLANSSEKLVAYVVESTDSSSVQLSVMTKIQNILPAYMLPDYVELLSTLPLTPSGKVDRNHLTTLPIKLVKQGYVPPSNVIEKSLVDIWKHCLKIDDIGITDNFFASGGDSILAVRTVTAIVVSGYQMSNAMLFTHQTIQELAAHLSQGLNTQVDNISLPIEQQINGVEVLGDYISADDLNSLLSEFK